MCLLAFYTNCTRTRNFILVPSLSRVKTIGNLFLFILPGRNNWNSDYIQYILASRNNSNFVRNVDQYILASRNNSNFVRNVDYDVGIKKTYLKCRKIV